MAADLKPQRGPSRGLHLSLLLAPFVLLPLGFLYFSSQSEARTNRATSSVFRQYLADRSSRMVVFSPETLPGAPIDRGVLRSQLTMLREKFDGLVLYRCDGETDEIVALAQSLGYRAIFLTIWDPKSSFEIRHAARLVSKYQSSLALAVSVGSEGLMEKRYSLDDVERAAYELQDSASGDMKVEVTTTESWWSFTHPDEDSAYLLNFGDFISTNIHVVWDTTIIDPVEAAEWTADRAIEVKKLTDKPLMVREAGFPGGGSSPRSPSHITFTRDMQHDFWEAWQTRIHRPGPPPPPLVIFEAIDNHEKQWASFEASWGLLSYDLKPHPAWDAIPELTVTYKPGKATGSL